MAQKHRFHNNRNRRSDSPADRRPSPPPYEPPVPVELGKPFMVLEDAQRSVFEFKGGQWVRFGMSIAEIRRVGEVKQMPQKINAMTRYEVRTPV